MTNTYAIRVARRKEFEVETDLRAIGLHPWVPRMLDSRYVKEKRAWVWYDKPYIPTLMFCVIPPIYWRDVVDMRHVIGKPEALSRLDIDGVAGHYKKGSGEWCPPVVGLSGFKAAVLEEYADADRARMNSDYQCKFVKGQALEITKGKFTGIPASFSEEVKNAHDGYKRLRLDVQMFGRSTSVEIDPDYVRAV